jgi:KUP system potassium uptake protein
VGRSGDGGRSSWLVALGALGVVFGDIGTSPLYALRTVLGESTSLDTTTVYGMTSTMIWSMLAVVTVLYVAILLRTDNQGEGGVLALVALLRQAASTPRLLAVVAVLGMVGAAMFLGDSVITPAISVLSAAEGLEVANPSLKAVVVPFALALLLGVFLLQRLGSGGIGRLYGPVMLAWFLVLAVAGAVSLVRDPAALQALSPYAAVRFFLAQPLTAFLSLGSVVLAVTGAEALYADLGHFGRAAITRAWLFLVFPALVVAYLGEAGEVVRHPSAAGDPFYAVVPGWATIPVLVLATGATVIASEAVIAGAFTVLHQAGGLGLFPFLRTRHPSDEEGGQIYIPAANWVLAFAVLAVVVGFRSSARLASAYGVAVSATILVTATLYLVLDRIRSRRTTRRQVTAVAMELVVLGLFAASVPKIAAGGWLPTGIGVLLFVVMSTWVRGQSRLDAARRDQGLSASELFETVEEESGAPPHRVAGSAVFLTADRDLAPFALRTVLERTHVLHECVLVLSWRVEDTPAAPPRRISVDVDRLSDRYPGIIALDVTLGYRDRLDAVGILEEAVEQDGDGLGDLDPRSAVYFVSDPIPRLTRHGGMARWRQRVFVLMDRLSTDRVEQLSLPRDRTVVIGREFDL